MTALPSPRAIARPASAVSSPIGSAESNTKEIDVALIGGGIMSATLGTMISLLEPTWKIVVFERLPAVALESSDPWNNAGTGHAAYCELNYTPSIAEPLSGVLESIDTAKAVKVNNEFQQSLRFWEYLFAHGIIEENKFKTQVPHITFVQGQSDVDFLRCRYEALKKIPAFESMEFTEDPAVMAKWAPLVIKGRDEEPTAATRVIQGTDIDFGSLTRQLFTALANRDASILTNTEVTDLIRKGPHWHIKHIDKQTNEECEIAAKFVFVGAGGGTLPLLQKAKLKEIRGYAGFPISGKFLKCTNKEIIEKHHAKVYAKAAIGAPPMSVPHLDTRIIDGEKQLVFGPFAGFSPKYLKHGLKFGLFTSVRWHNIIPMISAGMANTNLTKYLIKEIFSNKQKRHSALQELFPSAKQNDWELITAGQRVQIIKPDPKTKKGTLAFGTEVVTSADGTIAGLLGASPGASTAAAIALEVLKIPFPATYRHWLSERALPG